MTRGGERREAIVKAASKLFRRQGYAGTGVNDILTAADAPRGSLYYYFPEGKEAIGVAAIEHYAQRLTERLRAFSEGAAPADLPLRMTRDMADWLERTGYAEGCGVTTTLLETTPGSETILAAARAAYDAWRRVIEARLIALDVPQVRAEALAYLALSSVQGATVLARAEQSRRPLTLAGQELARIFAAEAASGH